jgi:hypothetical protein
MDTPSAPRPRRFRLQFSLRLLLIAFTAFAIGFPIWYRWPYQEVLEERDPVRGALMLKRITTWQRQWGGGRLLHGKSEVTQYWIIFRSSIGSIVTTTNYVAGRRNGPYTVRSDGPIPITTGQYVDDMREGIWTVESGFEKSTVNYHRDKIDGAVTIEWLGSGTKLMTAFFEAGKLVSFNGEPVQDHLRQVLESGVVDERTAKELQVYSEFDFVETPLVDVIDYLKDKHNLPIMLDAKLVPNAELPITDLCVGLDFASTLTLLTAPRGLACDYRYGCLWLTTAEDARDWHDPTGVTNVKPQKDSALNRVWNEPVNVDAVDLPLANAIATITQRLAIEIDTSQIQSASKYLVTHQARSIPFHDMLGQLLYRTGCRCKLDGDRLAILPPE